MLVAFGLGNPGDRYSNTRHNLGKNVVLHLASRIKRDLSPGGGHFFYCIDDQYGLALVVSTCFMNESGKVAVEILERFGIELTDLLVVCDDFSLPLGTIRIRKSGGDGGHNGLASIIYHLGSNGFPRLRLGIGDLPEGMDPSEFVLSDFSPDEQPIVEEVIATASQAILYIVGNGIDKAMNVYNRRLSR